MTTVSEFIDSDALEACVVSNCPYYREKFREIATRAGVLHAEIEDTHTGKKSGDKDLGIGWLFSSRCTGLFIEDKSCWVGACISVIRFFGLWHFLFQ